jgi:hypothetical protein
MRILAFLFCFICIEFSAQTKVEKEERVKDKEVPEVAFKTIEDNVKPRTKVRWYFQQDGDKKVYEAKFEHFQKQFSVEFNTNAKIYNVEIIVQEDNINKEIYENIETECNSIFEDYTLIKIQTEYLGEPDDLIDIIEDYEIDEDLESRYEIEVNAKIENQRNMYELIFDYKGELISKRKIKTKSTDIFDY